MSICKKNQYFAEFFAGFREKKMEIQQKTRQLLKDRKVEVLRDRTKEPTPGKAVKKQDQKCFAFL